jgi:hypothetical protein
MSNGFEVPLVGCEDCEFFIRGECIMQDEEVKPCQCGSWEDDA